MVRLKTSDRVLIAGGTGFVGRHLAKRCLEETPHVVSLGLRPLSADAVVPAGLECLVANVSHAGEVREALAGRQFEYVFNLSGYVDHTPYFSGGRTLIESHLTGVCNLVEALDRSVLKGFVQVGSSDEYGLGAAPQTEDMREAPISPYSFAKVAATHFIQMLASTEEFPGVVVRWFLIYGPGQDEKRFLPQVIKGCLKNERIATTEGRQLRDFCYVDDVVEGTLMACLTPAAFGHVLNIASGKPVAIRDMMAKVRDIIGGGQPQFGARPYRKGESMALFASVKNSRELLGWEPAHALEEGLKKTIDYYRSTMKE